MVRVHEELRMGGVNRRMKTLKRMRHTPLLLALLLVAMMALPAVSMAAPVRLHEELRMGGVNRRMKTLKRMRHTPLLLALLLVAMMALPAVSMAAPVPL